ncbi:MAG: ABC transporter ATP-binding protein [Spirochaetia bacterium]|jgi:branched-chain amino acid transport system ATP-binding protein|uniref:Leucine/isoleucine/valine transporter subunit ATP-binding component of ABC superfamily n=2 Tax=root TaxID=1 RepID=A0A652ZX66_9SPIR|nr:ABC transporter ATP-binding protein [Spirochaetia bacterium]MDD3819768.1 ABC transporter ATP-binding protein [Spirochaetales bacterium]NLX44319.1 ABC transporter ATP-binding protein [Treponema sp.]VBB40408.1 leucine/isoleucine/valine transporter subunit; ATP-binding component of ABC superfamily [uncultured Spirochaetota bacterium]MCE1209718.1 ABC transporter ATP-binding protein [Spirochaetia bacterium]
MLKIKDLHVSYGGIRALKGVSLEVRAGEIVTIIGANGAGKSTLLNTISGFLRPTAGDILYKGQKLAKRPDLVVQSGICHVPEGRLIFANLSVLDNLRLGAYLRADKKAIRDDMDKVFALFPRLKEREQQMAGTLSGGEQQMLAMGRALMTQGELILMDEPSLGLAPLLVKTVFEIIETIRSMGKTILLVEQNAFKALAVADRAYVLEQGRIVTSGPVAQIAGDPAVRAAYLGSKSGKI